jgi:AmmeMemoRadiSam system protein A
MNLAQFAKQVVEEYVKSGKTISATGLPEEFLKNKAGVFVTIYKNKELRGCIGTYLPTKKNIAEETIQSAIAAATEDYRFGEIKKEELFELSYEVSVLEEPKPIKNRKELDPKKYGIVVKSLPKTYPTGLEVTLEGFRFKTGLLLPEIEGIDTAEEQISIACQKAGINPLKENITIYKFKVKKYQ